MEGGTRLTNHTIGLDAEILYITGKTNENKTSNFASSINESAASNFSIFQSSTLFEDSSIPSVNSSISPVLNYSTFSMIPSNSSISNTSSRFPINSSLLKLPSPPSTSSSSPPTSKNIYSTIVDPSQATQFSSSHPDKSVSHAEGVYDQDDSTIPSPKLDRKLKTAGYLCAIFGVCFLLVFIFFFRKSLSNKKERRKSIMKDEEELQETQTSCTNKSHKREYNDSDLVNSSLYNKSSIEESNWYTIANERKSYSEELSNRPYDNNERISFSEELSNRPYEDPAYDKYDGSFSTNEDDTQISKLTQSTTCSLTKDATDLHHNNIIVTSLKVTDQSKNSNYISLSDELQRKPLDPFPMSLIEKNPIEKYLDTYTSSSTFDIASLLIDRYATYDSNVNSESNELNYKIASFISGADDTWDKPFSSAHASYATNTYTISSEEYSSSDKIRDTFSSDKEENIFSCDKVEKAFSSDRGENTTNERKPENVKELERKIFKKMSHKEERKRLPCGRVKRTCYGPPGKLGVLIDTSKSGPVVHEVKDSSPLRGVLYPGDLIIAIDDVDVRSMTAAIVTSMMAKRIDKHRKMTILSAFNTV